MYWLVKTEPITYSIDHLARDKTTNWDGVRNYQARNYLKSMQVGDKVFVYHSVTDPIGIAGLAEVAKIAYAEPCQFQSKSEYYDEKATKANPRWFCPDLKFVRKFNNIVPLEKLRKEKQLGKMALLQKGSRLSVMPISETEFKVIMKIVDA